MSAELASSWERRQRALTRSISDFALAITSLPDTDDALQQLLQRTRTLLDTDMAMMSFNDQAAGRTRITHSDGVFTEAYRQLSMPFGIGVLGRIAASGGPVQTSDYLTDTTVERDPAIDTIVEAEGVRAALGAPLRIRGQTVGVLMVADREPHLFTHDESAILQTLANLAAVAVDAQRRVDDERRATAHLRGQMAELVKRVGQQRRIVQVDEALIEAFAAGGGLAALRDGMSREFGREVRLVDLTVRYALSDELTQMIDSERVLVSLSARQGEPVTGRGDDGSTFTVMTAEASGEPIAAVLVDGDLEPGEEELLRRSARMLDTFLRAHHRELGDMHRRRHDLISELLSPPATGISPSSLLQLDEFGVRNSEPFRIVVADGTNVALDDLEHRLELDFGATLLRARIGERLISIAPEPAFEVVEHELGAPGARRRGALLVGHSPTLHRLSIAPEEFALVLRVLEAARRSGHTRTLVSLESYGALGAFLTKVTIEPTKLAIDQILGPLIEYDREHGTALLETTATYLDSAHSAAVAAKVLHVHENTVRQRLERVTELLGDGWSVGRRGLDIHVMLAAHRLVGA